jgi:hypothetical protein
MRRARIFRGQDTVKLVGTRTGCPSHLVRGTESLSGPNAGLTELLLPAGYSTTVYDPVFALSTDKPSHTPTTIPEPGLPFSGVRDQMRVGAMLGDAFANYLACLGT